MSVSCVFASDNSNATVFGDYPPLTVDVDNITVPGTYDDLNNDIQTSHPAVLMTLLGIISLTVKAKP